jgi:hypothetical protein
MGYEESKCQLEALYLDQGLNATNNNFVGVLRTS